MSMKTSRIHIGGLKVAYYYICKTKLWLFSHFISLENKSSIVEEGKVIHDIYYEKYLREIKIDNEISIDIVKRGNSFEIKEIKKSKKLEKAHEIQMKYYLYYLMKKGINVSKGIIVYPLQRRVKEVTLSQEDMLSIEKILQDIENIIKNPSPPLPMRKSYCKKCAYYEFCFGDV